MLRDELPAKISLALKAKDQVRLSTLRLLSSELHNYQIDNAQMSAEDEVKIVKKEIKRRRDAIDAYQKAGRKDLEDKEKAELRILEEFAPPEMSDEELERIVGEVIKASGAKSQADIGMVMPKAMAAVAGQADGSRVAVMVRQMLSN